MKAFRLHRLFHPVSGRCFGVALDGSFPGGDASPTDLEPIIGELAGLGVDALRLTLEQAEHLQSIPGRQRPALILRADVTNAFVEPWPDRVFCRIVGNIVEHALRLDAVAIAIHFLDWPGHPNAREHSLENFRELREPCDRWCLPLIVDHRPASDGSSDIVIEADLLTVATTNESPLPQLLRSRSHAISPREASSARGLLLEQPLNQIGASLDQIRHDLAECHRAGL